MTRRLRHFVTQDEIIELFFFLVAGLPYATITFTKICFSFKLNRCDSLFQSNLKKYNVILKHDMFVAKEKIPTIQIN